MNFTHSGIREFNLCSKNHTARSRSPTSICAETLQTMIEDTDFRRASRVAHHWLKAGNRRATVEPLLMTIDGHRMSGELEELAVQLQQLEGALSVVPNCELHVNLLLEQANLRLRRGLLTEAHHLTIEAEQQALNEGWLLSAAKAMECRAKISLRQDRLHSTWLNKCIAAHSRSTNVVRDG